MSLRITIALHAVTIMAACAADADSDLWVGEWHVDEATIAREAARRGQEKCEAVDALCEEELIRLEYCSRVTSNPACSGDRAKALADAVEDAHLPGRPWQVAEVAAESRFLAERESQEPGLSRKLAERRATRGLLRERAEVARHEVRVRMPAGCERRRPVATR